MANKTNIEWCDATWNPVIGCSRVSAGCENCYAIRQAHRIAAQMQGVCAAAMPKGPTEKQRKAAIDWDGLTRRKNGRIDWAGEVRCLPERLSIPLRWEKPRRIFVNSMSDLFHPSVPDEFIAAVFGVMAACPQHTFQVLSKRAERLPRWFEWLKSERKWESGQTFVLSHAADHVGLSPGWVPPENEFAECEPWPLPNVHLGVSVEDQPSADWRIPCLLQAPAAVRWLSCEPLLGPLDVGRYLTPAGLGFCPCLLCRATGVLRGNVCPDCFEGYVGGIGWLIVGCESGPGARPMQLDWVRSIRDQCAEAGVPFFFKQAMIGGKLVKLPELDGVEHNGYPEGER